MSKVSRPPRIEYVPVVWRYVGVAGLCLLVSAGGVLRAVRLGNQNEGGRGGALATMIALTIFLLRRDYGMWYYQDRISEIKDLSPIDELTEKIRAVEKAMFTNSRGQTKSNYWLAVATVIGTFFWGFGDLIVKRIMGH